MLRVRMEGDSGWFMVVMVMVILILILTGGERG